MAPTILIIFCGFIVQSKNNNMILLAFPRKVPETRKIFFNFVSVSKVAPKPADQSCSNAISRVPLQISPAQVLNFRPTLKIKGSLHKKQENKLSDKREILQNTINCFCCYVIKLAGETAKKVLLTVIRNRMLIEIHLSQIRISESKREKVCAVCPYLLF